MLRKKEGGIKIMLNIDKFRDEILEEIEHRKRITDKDNVSYYFEVYFNSIETVMERHGADLTKRFSEDVAWLLSEYEPPLLKTGDGLEPGDWIMVRDDCFDEWKKKPFLFYKNGLFYTVDDGLSIGIIGKYAAWTQARLPIEGNTLTTSEANENEK